MDNSQRVIIIGAGIAGLSAAIELEEQGLTPVILEKSDRAGGCIKTDRVDGWLLDRGFQVLLTAYPTARKILDYDALDLQTFQPGSIIYSEQGRSKIGDPSRNMGFLWPTLISGVGSLSDQIKVLSLNNEMKRISLETIFSEPEITSMQFLETYGFSQKIIENFFQPFFSGIFFDEALVTSSRKLRYVFKMFAEGYAAIPKQGMEAIPKQMVARLKNTVFRFNTQVASVYSGSVRLASGDEMKADQVIIATEGVGHKNNAEWKGCHTFYFEVDYSSHKMPILGLLAIKNTLVNNLYFVDDLLGRKNDKSLLSVSVINDKSLSVEEMEMGIRKELNTHCNIEADRLVKHYHIPKSIPVIDRHVQLPIPEKVRLRDGVWLAGGHCNNGSINGAMDSGIAAARFVVQELAAANP